MMPPEEFFGARFAGKKVMVTGHTGFKGAWLSTWLLELGAEVLGFSLEPPTTPSLFESCALADHVDSVRGDVRDRAHLTRVLASFAPEYVFHLAAQPLVRLSYRSPAETFETNVMGTVNVLEAVRSCRASVRVCQIITSDKCYRNHDTGEPQVESNPMGGKDPYSASKGAAELAVAAYRDAFFAEPVREPAVSVSSVRAGNVIGGGDWGEDRIVPDCIRALARGAPVTVRNPNSIRPWQHVLDALSGYLWLAALQTDGSRIHADGWNFGPARPEPHTVATLVDKIIERWGTGSWQSVADAAGSAVQEAGRLLLDCSRARDMLGWNPVYDLEAALRVTVDWYRRTAREAVEPLVLTRQQIRDYMQLAADKEQPWASFNMMREPRH